MNEEIKLEYLHLCDYACPAFNGKINLLGVFESFFMQKELSKMADFYVALNIKVKARIDYKISFEIQSGKDNEKIYVDKEPIMIKKDTLPVLSFNILKPIKEIVFKDFGDYKFIVLVNDLPIGYKEIRVEKLEIKSK